MKNGKKQRSRSLVSGALRGVGGTLLALAVLLGFFTGVSRLEGGSDDEGRRQLEDSIRRTAAACYAAEGVYPPTLAYMEENYGLQVDRSRYAVDYQIFASNLMPDITVLEQTGAPGALLETGR